MKTDTPSLAHLVAEVRDATLELDWAIANWSELEPEEVGERAIRYVEARQKFRQAVTT